MVVFLAVAVVLVFGSGVAAAAAAVAVAVAAMTMCAISSLIVFISILSAVISKLLMTFSNDDGDDGDHDDLLVLLVGRQVLLFWMHIVRCLLGLMILEWDFFFQKSGISKLCEQ